MKRFSIILVAAAATLFITSCQPKAYEPDDVFKSETQVQAILDAEPNGYIVYGNNGSKHLNDFLSDYMTEEGNKYDAYRTRSEANIGGKKYYVFSIDTLPVDGKAIYLRGRITTDDYGGNFYKAMVIQENVEGQQQNLRLSVDIGSASGLYQLGQEVLIRCNGLSVGRYANQPQLCVPSYVNNLYAMNATEKVGWAPGRIPNELFRRATTLIGKPDQSKILCDVVTIDDFFNNTNIVEARKMDGRLVRLENIHFTGELLDSKNAPIACNHYTAGTDSLGMPEIDPNADVFGPTTNNIGFPQSRVIADASDKRTLVSTSEYAKYAYFWLPAPEYVGSVTGILGFYVDKGGDFGSDGTITGYKWAITPRDILIIKDIVLKNAAGEEWEPVEFVSAE